MLHEGSRTDASSDIRQILTLLRKRKWSILLITALTVGSALFFSSRQTPVYESTAQVLVTPTNVNQLVQGAATLVSMDTEQAIADSSAVALLAAEQLGTIGPGQVQDATEISIRTNTQFLEITFSSTGPADARRGAQTVAESYLQFRAQTAIDDASRAAEGYREQLTKLDAQIATLQEELADLRPGSPEAIQVTAELDQRSSSADVLRSQLLELTAQSVDPGQIVAQAELPTSPSSPDHVRNGVLALIVGLALGLGLAFLRERLDDRLTGREDLEQALGASVLAIVPQIAGWRRKEKPRLALVTAPKSGAAEAYRTIRTNLQYIARDGSFKVFAVASASQGEGKTTTVANLAVTLAQTGKRVVAISCDLRKPRLHRFFDLSNDVGLTTVLQGEGTVPDVAQRPRDIGSLRIIASGPRPPDPAEVLASESMETLLRDLRPHADFILIDTPPVLAVSDVLVVAPLCDGIVMLADAASTSSSAITLAREQLTQVGANIVGGVLNNLDLSHAKYYYPGYYHYYAYDQRPEKVRSTNGGNGRKRAEFRDADLWR